MPIDLHSINRFELMRKTIRRLPLPLIGFHLFIMLIMPFRLKNASTVFPHIVMENFWDHIHNFLEIYLDDCVTYILLKHHVLMLRLMFDQCKWLNISLYLKNVCCTPFEPCWGTLYLSWKYFW